jgi:hypothetical protein
MGKRLSGPAVLVSLLLLSCSGQADVAIRQNGAAEISLDLSLGDHSAALLRSFSSVLGAGPGPVIDGPAVAASISAAPGVAGAELSNRDPASIGGSITLTRIDEFLRPPAASGNAALPFITWDGAGTLAFSLDRETSPALMALFSADVGDYLSALMAPCATGDPLSRQEYVALLGSVYGRALADEVSAARIGLGLEVPGTVTGTLGGSFRGRRARFEIPLLDFLVLDRPLRYEVSWTQ